MPACVAPKTVSMAAPPRVSPRSPPVRLQHSPKPQLLVPPGDARPVAVLVATRVVHCCVRPCGRDGGASMRVVVADIEGTEGLTSKDTVVGGYGSCLRPFSRVTRVIAGLKGAFLK